MADYPAQASVIKPASPLQLHAQQLGERNLRLGKLLDRLTGITTRMCGPNPPSPETSKGGPQSVPTTRLDELGSEAGHYGDLLNRLENQIERLDGAI